MEADDLREVVTRYYEFRSLHDADGALGQLDEEFQIEFAGGPVLNKAQAAQSLGWDFGTNGKVDWEIVEEGRATIVVEGAETNDFLRLLGIAAIPFRSQYHFAENGLIVRQQYSAHWEGISIPDALAPAIAWASENSPQQLAEAYPGGQMVYTEQAARAWVALLQRWRLHTGPDKPE